MIASIERRASSRNSLSGIVRVRTVEAGMTRIQKICSLSNTSSQSVYFFIEKLIVRERTQLIVSFPNAIDPSAAFQDCPVEIVRQDALPGRFGVAAKLLHNIQLRLRDGLIVPEVGFWSGWPLVSPSNLNVYA